MKKERRTGIDRRQKTVNMSIRGKTDDKRQEENRELKRERERERERE